MLAPPKKWEKYLRKPDSGLAAIVQHNFLVDDSSPAPTTEVEISFLNTRPTETLSCGVVAIM